MPRDYYKPHTFDMTLRIFNMLVEYIKHFSHVACFISWMAFGFQRMTYQRIILEEESRFQQGYIGYCYYAIILFFICLAIPQVVTTTAGLLVFSPFHPKEIKVKGLPSNLPFICVRVVTRGTYPELVRRNVVKHIEILQTNGIENFVVEVVTDRALNVEDTLMQNKHVKETVVPEDYQCTSNARKKARALQYCLENNFNFLAEDDYVVHLDEETIFTCEAIRGIMNFIAEGKHMLGQGIITYGMLPVPRFATTSMMVQHHICTIADSLRVADDLGKNKAQFRILHQPYFGMKGSYVVAKFKAERDITWDFGPEGSVAEDAWFALAAIEHGYTIDLIEGDMLERSPFTVMDFIKQRQRWMQGLFLVAFVSPLKMKSKILLMMSVTSWLVSPIYTFGIIVQGLVLANPPFLIYFLQQWVGNYYIYLHFIGYLRQFKLTSGRIFLVLPNVLIGCAANLLLESIAALCALKNLWDGDWYGFYLVQKEAKIDYDINSNAENSGVLKLSNKIKIK